MLFCNFDIVLDHNCIFDIVMVNGRTNIVNWLNLNFRGEKIVIVISFQTIL